MPHINRKSLSFVTILLFSLINFPAIASHLVGGGLTYEYIGSSTKGDHYRVTLKLYQDATNGQPAAISDDDPAFLTMYDGAGVFLDVDTFVFRKSVTTLKAFYITPCDTFYESSPTTFELIFNKDYYVKPNTTGYVVAYQRCCRNSVSINTVKPGDVGITLSCTLPPSPVKNNSAVFKAYPPQIICLNEPLRVDHSATDADGDSISYELCSAVEGADATNIKPSLAKAPPYTNITYIAPYSATNPVSASTAFAIDPVTGLITGVPDKSGRYIMAVCANEWRAGKLINSIRSEFEFMVQTCTPVAPNLAGPDTVVTAGDSVFFYSSGAISYAWTPRTFLSDTSISNPIGHFTVPGTFRYLVYTVNAAGCKGVDTVDVSVLGSSMFFVPTGFTPNGDNLNDILKPIPAGRSVLKSFRVFDRKGSLMYEGDDVNDGWDGKYNGVIQSSDAYIWQAIYTDSNGKTSVQRGQAILIR